VRCGLSVRIERKSIVESSLKNRCEWNMESYEKKQPVAFGGQYHFVAPVPLREEEVEQR